MKKIVKKLALNKQTMALLDEKEMANVKGGAVITARGCRYTEEMTCVSSPAVCCVTLGCGTRVNCESNDTFCA